MMHTIKSLFLINSLVAACLGAFYLGITVCERFGLPLWFAGTATVATVLMLFALLLWSEFRRESV